MLARYIKFTTTANNYTDPYTIFSEIEVYQGNNIKIPLTTAMITAPAPYSTYSLAQAIDGNTGTLYANNIGFPNDLIIDLGQTYDVTKFRRYTGSQDGLITSYNPKNYIISFATVAGNYTVVTTRTNEVSYNTWIEEIYATALVVKYLFQNGTDDGLSPIVYYSGGTWQTIPLTSKNTVSQTDFEIYGTTSIPAKAALDLLQPNYRLLTWTDNLSATYNYTLKAVPKNQLIFAESDFPLTNVQNVDWFNVTGGQSGGGVVRMAVSPDGGATYYGHNGTAFVPIVIADVNNPTDADRLNILTNGMTLTQVKNTGITDWTAIYPQEQTNKRARWAYLLGMESTTDTAYTDSLTVQTDKFGSEVMAKETEYNVSVTNTAMTVTWIGAAQTELRINYVE